MAPAPVFQIQLDDPQEYHVGGGVLSGKLLLVVSGSHALSLKDMVLRVICDVETSIETEVDGSSKTKILKGSMRLYDGEMNLPLPSKHFAPGKHEIPFKFPLPSDRPRLPPTTTDVQQPTTFGTINFRLKAHARKGATSWFSSGEIKTDEGFMFMPPSSLTDENNNAPAMRQQVISGYVGGAASELAQSDNFWSRLTGSGSKRRKEPPLEVQCYLNEPTTGLAQDRATQFQFRIVSSNPQEPVMVQSISLTLETVVTLVANGVRISNRRGSQPLVQAKVLRSGTEVDVSDLLSAVEIRSTVLPTFQTPLITYNHALVVQVSLVRAHHHRGESANIVQRLPIRVLSPYIIDDQTSATDSFATGSMAGSTLSSTAAMNPSDVKVKYNQTNNPPEKPARVISNPDATKARPVRKPVQGPTFIQSSANSYGPAPGSSSMPEKQSLAMPGSSTNVPHVTNLTTPGPSAPGPSAPRSSGSSGVPGAPEAPEAPGVPAVQTHMEPVTLGASVTSAQDEEQPPSDPPPAYYE